MVNCLRLMKIFRYFPRYTSTLSQQFQNVSENNIFDSKKSNIKKNVKGWIQSLRKMKSFMFIKVNDGSCNEAIPVVIPYSILHNELSYGCSISITGHLQKSPKGEPEILAKSVDYFGKLNVMDDYPFTPGQKHSLDYCRSFLHLRPKTRFFSSLLRIRHSTTIAVHKFFSENNFIGIHTPILTSNDCEGAGETFVVQSLSQNVLKNESNKESDKDSFFNNDAFLTVSGQFHLEAITRSIPKVYAFNPAFRAEKSKSRLHLSEFYMIEAEEAFINNLTPVLFTIEKLLKYLILNLISNCEKDLVFILKSSETNWKNHILTLENLLKTPFTVMCYLEAKNIIKNNRNKIQYEEYNDSGFTKEEELILVNHNGNKPIFIINWPKRIKPFYMKATNENLEEVQAVDLLVPVVGELCGGSIREDDYEKLYEKLSMEKLLEHLDWYLQLRKFGNIPTGGFGIGFERFLQFVLNVKNIKDTIPFPRWPHNLQL